jgi:hypothetical protein
MQQLINTALLGTEKAVLEENILPDAIQKVVANIPVNDREARFLKNVASYFLYQEAGQKPKRFEGDLQIENTEGTIKIASEKYGNILSDIIEIQYYFRNDLIELWLNKLIKKQQIAPPKSIVILIGLAESLPKKFRPKINQVIGERGRNLLQFKGLDWQPTLQLTDNQIWEEGRLAERREFFMVLRKENPAKAIELLEKTWSQESLTDKVAFLEIIKNNFQTTDTAFLTQILPEFKFKSKEKKSEKAARKIIVGLLISVENSDLQNQVFESFKALFPKEKSKGLLGWFGKDDKKFYLPEQEDEFWNQTKMDNNFGFENSPDVAIFKTNQRYWLSCFLEIIPFEFWEKLFEKDTLKTVNLFINEDFTEKLHHGLKQTIFLNALMENVIHFKNKKLANDLITVRKIYEDWTIFKIFSQEEKEKYLIEQRQLTNQNAIQVCFEDFNGIWSEDFSIKILKECFAAVINNNTYLSDRLGALMAQFLHPNSISILSKLKEYPNNASTSYIAHWEKFFVDAIQKKFEIKQRINQEIN